MAKDEHGIDIEEDTALETEDDEAEDADEELEAIAEETDHEDMEAAERRARAEEETNPDKHRDDPSQVS